MGTDSELKKATEAVDEAWRQWKASPSKKSEAVYDHAYMAWKKLGGERGVGRPPGGDQAALTSTERARAARARQQQSAARWEQVAPVIQRLRSAVEAQDDVGALALAKSLVNQTTVVLKDFSVIHAQPNTDLVVLHCWHGKQVVLASIPKIHLEDHFRRDRLTGKQANLVVDRNLQAFARIISSKYERGEYRPYSRLGSTFPRVDVTLDDIESSGETLTDSVLSVSAGWVGPDGRWSPA